ncbi:MAG: hypothetical protein E7349_00025 [Clostridiales bacterium]|nr:hypothetical protein [Clostridiales bacterium]
MTLNLKTSCVEHNVLKEYLEENASATLAEKINHGVFIEKDGKRLLNRKDLDGFMKYACEEARKLAAKGATSACIKDDVVFGWAIHYFEEDEIIGKLYNEDGSEYKPPKPEYKPIQRVPAPSIPVKPTPPKAQQFNLFDMMAQTEESKADKSADELDDGNAEPTELNVDMETGEILSYKTAEKNVPRTQGSSLYQKYIQIQNQYPQAVIAYRLGDFFEVFGDNAVKVSNRLELTLTGRDCGLEERVAMVGFPYYAADVYFKKISAFAQLVIVDGDSVSLYQIEEPPLKPQNEPSLPENFDDNDDFEEERALQKFFDKDALCPLYELFDYNLDMQ